MNLDDILDLIQQEQSAALYFSGKNCNVCNVLKPKIIDLLDSEFPNIKQAFIDIEQTPEISSYFSVFSIPTLLIFFNGKEFIRKSRNMSIPGLKEELKRPYTIFFE